MNTSIGLLLLLIGIIAGGYGAIVGAGGGFIYVPALLLILDMNPSIAAGTGLVIVLINSISAVSGYASQKKICYKTGILIAIGALPGSLVGVWFLHIYSSHYFFIIFAVVLISLGLFLFFQNSSFKKKLFKQDNKEDSFKPKSKLKRENYFNDKLLLPIGLLMGLFSSYLGIGGGWLLVPILVYFFKFPTHYATATSIFSLGIYSSYGVISQIFYNSISWIAVIWGAIGIIIGSQIGVRIAQKISGRLVMQMLSILLILIGFRMYFE